jgi:hypothetical protein
VTWTDRDTEALRLKAICAYCCTEPGPQPRCRHGVEIEVRAADEIERLRHVCDDLERRLEESEAEQTRREGDALEERRAIVAWLRDCPGLQVDALITWTSGNGDAAEGARLGITCAADAIERGEHLK